MSRPPFRRLRRFAAGGSDPRRELEEEFAAHLEHAARDLAADGLDPAAAAEEARRRFGSMERYRAVCLDLDRRRLRARHRLEALRDLGQDLRFAARAFRRGPGFVVAAVLTLALGIGANTAIFSVVYGVLLQPLPYPDPERLVMLWDKNPERGWDRMYATRANVLDWQERNRVFSSLAATRPSGAEYTLTGSGAPEVVRGLRVYGDLCGVLGVPPLLGRGLRPADTWSGEAVAVISHGLWQRRLGGDSRVIGRVLQVDGFAVTVIGVMPPGFAYPEPGLDLWVPYRWTPEQRAEVPFRRAHSLRPVARLRPGVSVEQARAELAGIAAQLAKEYPATNEGLQADLTPLREWIVGDSRLTLLVLLAAVGLVLLVACANVANLQLSRSTVRAREVAVRSALGASRGRLLRQLGAESLLLSLLGGVAGLGLAAWGLRALLALAPGGAAGSPGDAAAQIPRLGEIALHPPVLLFTLGVALCTGLLFGLAPALQTVGGGPADALDRRRAGAGPRGQRARGALVVCEIALAVVLVAGAGLLTKSFFQLRHVDPGFQTGSVLTAAVSLPPARYGERREIAAFVRRLQERVAALPGVETAAVVDHLPMTGLHWTSDFTADGWPPERFGMEVHRRLVSPGYFQAVGVPVLRGRAFTDADDPDAPPVVLINESLARRDFPGEDPLGRRIITPRHPDPNSVWMTIVGVVADEKLESLAAGERPEIFQPFAQEPEGTLRLVVRAAGGAGPERLAPSLRAALREIDRDLPLYDVRTLQGVVDRAVARERFLMLLMGIFAGVALLLAAVGVFAVLSYAVTQRTREIGVRMALGAAERQVLRLVVGRALALVTAGMALGAAGALAFGRLLQSLLFRVAPADPAVLAGVALLLTLAALVSSYLPARRATRVDPAIALRQE